MYWYRPPKTTIETIYKFEEILIRIDPISKEYYIWSDLNCDVMSSNSGWHTTKLKDILDNFQLYQLIDELTSHRTVKNTNRCIYHK